MIKHILKHIWNQRKSNSWLLGELLLVFVCLWYIVDYFLMILYTFNAPVGFDLSHTYQFQFNAREEGAEGYLAEAEHPASIGDDLWEALERIRRMPGVEAVSFSRYGLPYNRMDNYLSLRADTTSASEGVACRLYFVSPDYFDVYRIRPAATGKTKLKESLSAGSFIITEDAAARLFPGKDAVGQTVYCGGNNDYYTIGAVTCKGRGSEFDNVRPQVYINQSESDVRNFQANMLPWAEVSVRVHPDADRDFAETFMREKSNEVELGNLYLQSITPLSNIREDDLREGKSDMKTRIFIMLFLLLNIFLGIVGTFWFRTRQRQGEMGLRMALGSTRCQLKSTVMGEGLLLLSLVFVPAVLICLNIVVLDLTAAGLIGNTALRFVGGILLTFLLIAGMIVAGTWYPATEAARLEPAEALHYE